MALGKKPERKKQGIFFTTVAFALLVLALFSLSVYERYGLLEQRRAVFDRINSLDDFATDIQNDINRGIYITGFRTLLAAEEHIASTGEYINSPFELQTLFINGTINNETSLLMQGNTMSDWLMKIEGEAAHVNANLSLTLNNISISQQNPWQVQFSGTITLLLVDKSGIASFAKNITANSAVLIEGFEDPLYTVASFGKIINKINITPYESFVDGNNTENLLSELNDKYYRESASAPSFLMRLFGNFSASQAGIESLVDIAAFSAQGIPIRQKSIIDYLYFSTVSTTDLCIDNAKAEPDLPSWFRLDSTDNHIVFYGAASLMKSCG